MFSGKVYNECFAECLLHESSTILKSYYGSLIKPVGTLSAPIQFNGKPFMGEFFVVRNGAKPLIIRDILEKLNIVFTINSLDNIEVNTFIEKYSELLKDELGHYKFGKIHFEIKSDVKLIFRKPSKIPLAIVNSVDNEINRLIEQGVLELIPNSEWGTPIIPPVRLSQGKTGLSCERIWCVAT